MCIEPKPEGFGWIRLRGDLPFLGRSEEAEWEYVKALKDAKRYRQDVY